MFATCPDQGTVCWHFFHCPSTPPSPFMSFWNRLFLKKFRSDLTLSVNVILETIVSSTFRGDLTSSFMPSSWPALSHVSPGTLGKGLGSTTKDKMNRNFYPPHFYFLFWLCFEKVLNLVKISWITFVARSVAVISSSLKEVALSHSAAITWFEIGI